MNAYQIQLELLALADETPLTYVDIKPIVDKYTDGLDRDQQRDIRAMIRRLMAELEKEGEINVVSAGLNITTYMNGGYATNSCLIKSTNKRVKELETKMNTIQPITNIQHIEANYGNAIQGADLRIENLSTSNPITYPINPEANKAQKKWSWSKFLIFISDNKLIAGVLSTLIVAAILYLIFGIKPK